MWDMWPFQSLSKRLQIQGLRMQQLRVNLVVENNNVTFEIDTGLQHSVISKRLYSKLFSHIKLKNNDISLSDYVGNDIKPMGKIFVNSEYQNKKFTICLYVIDNVGPPFIGRNDIKKYKIVIKYQSWGVPVDHSEWATPIKPILKPDGTVRICGDFKITINPVLEGTEYLLPKIEHLYANISGSKYFSKIDLKDAYQQMVIKESDRKYTTINTHKGLFSYTRNPFGIKPSAREFQKAMETSTAVLRALAYFKMTLLHFQLETDHKPLIHIFGDKKGIPIYAANRLQQWAYVLSSFNFDIKYVKSEDNTVDFCHE
ncbi:Reverse transcriptase domain-containing protein [Aphis craccivora]|uniref:Reverse transcriptase domain-containing protein n=1 Tax=Aphis craccivora TaxID=307492 RepID=A0A6G0VR43_APHCR|nr:Reverse transcriptase domain-containing protein [Aphis craccivora]